jgi:hypothetical protein
VSTAPWTRQQRDDALRRGPHKSSQSEREFVSAEMVDFCRQGYWMVLPYSTVAAWPMLRISPLGVVPQRDRRPRLIVDYSFSQLNADTLRLAPAEAMQFGRALQRVLTRVVHADPRYGPVHLAKIDIADGFYRVWLQADDVLKLGVVLPTHPQGVPLIAFPLALPMGWVESPPYFTALTETVCDLANRSINDSQPDAARRHQRRAAHRLERLADTAPEAPHNTTSASTAPAVPTSSTLAGRTRAPVAAVDVYVDDFLLMAQTHAHRQKVMRATLHAIDEVFRPLDPTDPPDRKEPASVKKMLKGDAQWSTFKRILGWDIDTETSTLHLPIHRVDRLRELLSWLSPPHTRLSVKRWHQVLGELRSMSPALPGTRGLFSVLQAAFGSATRNRIRLGQHIHDVAADFSDLVDSVAVRPTRLQELVPTAPSDVGACDACQTGMGGVWFDALNPLASPIVWRQRFPVRVARQLVTSDNRHGAITISDLELTGMIAHKDILAQLRDVAERTVWIASDNRAAVAWSAKGSATSMAARAYLLRYNALHQRQHRYISRHHYIPGPVNVMADDASRRWDLTDHELLTHFDRTYPQASSWCMRTLQPATNAALIGALSRRRPLNASPLNALPAEPQPGLSGRPSVPASASTPLLLGTGTPYLFCNSTPNATATAPLRPVVTLSELGQWKTPYERWARRTPEWGPLTLA